MNLWATILLPLAILVGLVWDKLRERSKQPIFYYKPEEIISITDEFAEDIEIYFKKQKVTRVSITRIGLVNVGKDAIDEAVKNNVRKPVYIQKILENWQTDGRKNSKKAFVPEEHASEVY